MGREIRMVPPNYEHPKYFTAYGRIADVAMPDQSLEEAQAEWDEGLPLWLDGKDLYYWRDFLEYQEKLERPSEREKLYPQYQGEERENNIRKRLDFLREHSNHDCPRTREAYEEQYGHRPEIENNGEGFCYRTWRPEEGTWYQVWQTVSEGSPVTPPFETKVGLADYLATHGTFWDKTPWDFNAALRFIEAGWAPTMIASASGGVQDVREMFSDGGLIDTRDTKI